MALGAQSSSLLSGIKDIENLVFGVATEQRSIVRPFKRGGCVLNAIKDRDTFLLSNIPDSDGHISRGGSKGEISRWVELTEDHLLSMTDKLTIPLFNVLLKSVFRQKPEFHSSIFRGSNEKLIIEGREFKVDDRSTMTANGWAIKFELSEVVCVDYGKNTTTGTLPWDCSEDSVRLDSI
jgi:hypothetical protein